MELKEKIKKLPQSPGVYQFFDEEGQLLYVGKSISIKKRVFSYFSTKGLGPKTTLLVTKIKDVKYIKVFSEFEALLLESALIRQNQPFFNIQARDDKSPVYIKISNDKIPLISTTRKEVPKKGEFTVGPFQSSKTTKEVLRIIRRIFPYCHHKNPKKPCLFVHLGLCPYPWKSDPKAKQYKETIKNIKRLLKGKARLLMKNLTVEMNALSKLQKYEEAQEVKKQIEKLEYVTTTYHDPNEFLTTPTLVDDLTRERLEDLKQALELKSLPLRIECYDISNISGKMATGSMAVFENGEPAKSEYRKFKIKFLSTPNDFEMLKEVLARRFKNKSWKKADLIIIDGGKGQLTSALNIAKKYKVKTPIVSLAKRFEQIYVPSKVLPVSLPKESKGRQLAQALRDEAHRFAITYHRLLRSKNLLDIKK